MLSSFASAGFGGYWWAIRRLSTRRHRYKIHGHEEWTDLDCTLLAVRLVVRLILLLLVEEVMVVVVLLPGIDNAVFLLGVCACTS